MAATTWIRRLMIDGSRARFCSTFFRSQSTLPQNDNSNSRNPNNANDPFGLGDYTDNELSAVVQGLYSAGNEPNGQQNGNVAQQEVPVPKTDRSQAHMTQQEAISPPMDRTHVYKSWLDDSRTKRRNDKLVTGESELVHSAPFGVIRFDHDNVAVEGQEEVPEDYLPLEGRPAEVTRESRWNSEQSESNDTDEPDTSEANQKVASLLKKNDAVSIPSFPSAYQIQSLNDLTRAEMWTLLRENIIFQNNCIVAINKPYGLPIHSPSKECRHTMLEFLDELSTYCELSEQALPLHRLDKDTTGVLLFAKNQIAATIIKEKFAKREIHKKYFVITKNCPPMRNGTIDIPISEGRIGGTETYRSVLKPDLRKFKISNSQDGAKRALTHFRVISSNDSCAFLEVRPETGVKHQIRVHLGMGLGCPVFGDHKYSHRDKLAPQRLSPSVLKHLNIQQSKVRLLPLHLHCSSIEFTVPEDLLTNRESVFVHCRPPKHFMHTLKQLRLK